MLASWLAYFLHYAKCALIDFARVKTHWAAGILDAGRVKKVEQPIKCGCGVLCCSRPQILVTRASRRDVPAGPLSAYANSRVAQARTRSLSRLIDAANEERIKTTANQFVDFEINLFNETTVSIRYRMRAPFFFRFTKRVLKNVNKNFNTFE